MAKEIDASELRTLGADITRVGMKAIPKVEKSVFKGASNIKRGMQEELGASTHFRSIRRSVDFDIETRPNGVEAEIGPRHGSNEPGNLANIAYFGTSRGGGTVDFEKPMEEEAPRFEKAIGDILDGLI